MKRILYKGDDEVLFSKEYNTEVSDKEWIEDILSNVTDLSYVVFKDLTFEDVKIKNKVMIGAEFKNCQIKEILFKDCNLNHSVFENNIMDGIQAQNCKFGFTMFNNNCMTYVSFRHCYINTTMFKFCDSYNMWFYKCDLHSIFFQLCDISRIYVDHCNINDFHATICNMTHCKFDVNVIKSILLRNCDLYFGTDYCNKLMGEVNVYDCTSDKKLKKHYKVHHGLFANFFDSIFRD